MSDREISTNEEKLSGESFFENTRIRVSDIAVKYEQLGYTKEEILEAYPRLDEEDIKKVLNFYYRNKERLNSGFRFLRF